MRFPCFVTGNAPSTDPGGRVNGLSVDLNNIPTALIERTETVLVGGAPIYGSDAIAGTVNIILKEDYEGFETSFQYGDNIHGSEDNYKVTGLLGSNFADGRGNVVMSVDYESQSGVREIERPRLFNRGGCQPDGQNPCIPTSTPITINSLTLGGLPALSAGIPLPSFDFTTGRGGIGGTPSVKDPDTGELLTFDDATGRLVPFDPGTNPTGSIQVIGGDGFMFNFFDETVAPIERFVFTSLGHFDVHENVTVFWETNFLDSDATDLVNQPASAFQSALLATLPSQGAIGVSLDNPFLNPADRAILQANLDAVGLDTNEIFLNRVGIDFTGTNGGNSLDVETFRVVGGIKGEFPISDKNWNYELSYNFGETKTTSTQTLLLDENIKNALNAVRIDSQEDIDLLTANQTDLLPDVNGAEVISVIRNGQVVEIGAGGAQIGDILCNVFLDPPDPRTTDILPGSLVAPNPAVQGCVPLNPFGFERSVQGALDFVGTQAISRGKATQQDLLFTIGGEIPGIEMPAGPIAVSAGFERRREDAEFLPGGVLENGLSRQPRIARLDQTDVISKEVFGEVLVPILSRDFDLGLNDLFNFTVINSLEFQAAYRLLDTTVTGTDHAWTAGGQARLFDDLTIRGNFTRSTRTPNTFELFQPRVASFNQTGDPCDRRNITEAENPTRRQQNCLTQAQQLGFTDAVITDLDGDGSVGLVLDPNGNNSNAPDNVEFETQTVNAAILTFFTGNEALVNEVSESYTLGAIWQPHFIPNLTLGLDYINIDVKNVVEEVGLQFFTQQCFDAADFPANPACGQFTRGAPNFDIFIGNEGFANTAALKYEALTGQARYNFEVVDLVDSVASLFGSGVGGDWGSISIDGSANWIFTFRNNAFDSRLDANGRTVDSAGVGGVQDLSMQWNVHYQYGPLGFLWQTLYADNTLNCNPRIQNDCDDIPEGFKKDPRDAVYNATASYDFLDHLTFRAGVLDVMGNKPNFREEVFGSSRLLNFEGRRYFLQLTFRG